MTHLAFLVVASCCLSVFAQTPEQTGLSTSAATTASVRLSAEFTRKIDSKDAKVGEEVAARTTADATLADGNELPKGTRLVGTVVSVHAKSSAENTARLAFTFNRAVLRDGREIPLHVTLTSLTAPGVAQMAAAGSGDAMAAPSGLGAGPAGRASSASTGGLSGGGLGSGSGLGSGARGSKAAGATVGEVDTTPVQVLPARTGMNDPRAEGSSATGTYVSDALAVHHYPVGNMPGVVLSSQATASVSGSLDASGQNIKVDSGTRMTVNASVTAR